MSTTCFFSPKRQFLIPSSGLHKSVLETSFSLTSWWRRHRPRTTLLMMVFNRNRSQVFTKKCGPTVRYCRLQDLLAGKATSKLVHTEGRQCESSFGLNTIVIKEEEGNSRPYVTREVVADVVRRFRKKGCAMHLSLLKRKVSQGCAAASIQFPDILSTALPQPKIRGERLPSAENRSHNRPFQNFSPHPKLKVAPTPKPKQTEIS